MAKGVPGTLHDGGAAFAATHWTLVLASARSHAAPREAAAALAELCQTYWPPLYAFVRRRGFNPADAQDLTQGFFAHLLEHKAFAATDPAQGKFRSFLLAALKNFLADAWDRSQTLKRGGGLAFLPLDENSAEAAAYDPGALPELSAERLFEVRWARALVARALEVLGARMAANPKKARVFACLKPFLTGGAALPTYDEAAAALGVPVATVKTHVHRLRQDYRAILREEVARTVPAAGDVDEELRHLRAVLTEAGNA